VVAGGYEYIAVTTRILGHPEGVPDGFDYAMEKAPRDVRAALRWLIEQGARITSEHGGATESFGDVAVEFSLADATVSVVRDRHQWMMDIKADRMPSFDLDLIHQARMGTARWTRGGHADLPEQLPAGVSWAQELPHTLEWLRATTDAEKILKSLRRERVPPHSIADVAASGCM
jgi:hypothetical protein